MKQTLDLLELESCPKTSGSRGIHVLVPIARRHSFAEAREFASIVGSALERAHPGLVTTAVVEGETEGRARRREPEPPRCDECDGLLGSAPCGRARLDAAALGRGEVRARSCCVHDGRGARPRGPARRSLRRGARRQAVAEGCAEVAAARSATDRRASAGGRASRARRCRGGRRARPSSRRRRAASG